MIGASPNQGHIQTGEAENDWRESESVPLLTGETDFIICEDSPAVSQERRKHIKTLKNKNRACSIYLRLTICLELGHSV